MRWLVLGLLGLLISGNAAARQPNIVLILADDLGYGELGCYGQTKIQTPNLDRLAQNGIRFSQAYSGSPVCAPCRCVLMTGLHTGHAHIRNNRQAFPRTRREGQVPLPADTRILPQFLQQAGYTTMGVGKWGLGGPGSVSEPTKLGFDHWLGYLCQAHAHNHYTDHLYRDGRRITLNNPPFAAHQRLDAPLPNRQAYARYRGSDYAPDRMAEAALDWIDRYRDQPFFLYYATTVPHVGLQVPEDSLNAYLDQGWDQKPYLGHQGYVPHPSPRAAYAAMVSRLDRDVGRILARLRKHGLERDTLVIFTSDNGPTYNGGSDSEFFASTAGLRGLKGSVYEGGIRVPFIARWPGVIAPGRTSDLPIMIADLLPTLVELVGRPVPEGLDGISLLPTLKGKSEQTQRGYLYWELGRAQALRVGDWKLVRRFQPKPDRYRVELFNLAADPNEQRNLADKEPARLWELLVQIQQVRLPSAVFPSPFDRVRE